MLTCPEYEQVKKEFLRGWRTWNVNSLFSFVHMPDALTLNLGIKEYKFGNFLQNPLIGRFPTDDWEDSTEVLSPGEHAFDDSYTSMKVSWCGLELMVETASEEEFFAILVTPVKEQMTAPLLVLQGGYLWNREGSVKRENDVLYAQNPSGGNWFVFSSGEVTDEDLNVPVTGPFLSVKESGPAGFYAVRVKNGEVPDAGSGRERLELISLKIREARERLEEKHRAFGSEASLASAIECALAWDTVYDPNHDRVISPVSRLWSIRKGGYVLFCWDNFFAGHLAGSRCPELAVSNMIEIVNERTDKGFVPNMSCGNGQKTLDRSQPPVGSRMVLELYRETGWGWFPKLLYPALKQWNDWFFENRLSSSGAFCWGSDPAEVIFGNRWENDGVNDRFGGALESGMDNSPLYDDIPFDKETNMLMLEDVGLTGLILMDLKALKELAVIVGKEEDIPLYDERISRTEAGLEQLWDEEYGFYCNRRTDTGEFSRRIAPTNFYALFSENIPAERIDRIINEHYYNPEEFYGRWMLPSIARNDPAYQDQDYWRGRVWAPLNFLVYLAFEQHKLTDECRDLAEKSLDIFLPEWEEHRHVHENYNAISGRGCDAGNSDKFYHWGALLCAIALRCKKEG